MMNALPNKNDGGKVVRLQPDAERSAVGAVLLDPDSLGRIPNLRPEHFEDESLRVVFRTMKWLENRGVPPDLVAVHEALKSKGDLERIGGTLVLGDLLDAIATSSRIEVCAEIIVDRYCRQEAHGLLKTAAARALDPSVAIEDVIQDLGDDIVDLEAVGLARPAEISVSSFKDIAPMFENLRWLWQGWIAEGYLTMIAGDPGIGKSTLILKLAQIATQAAAWLDGTIVDPRFAGRPVIWLDTEGTQALTIERCRALGMDTERLLFPKDPSDPDDAMPIFRLHDRKWIEILVETIRIHGPSIVVVDSLRGSHTGDENSSEVQEILQRLAEVARDTQTAIVIAHHLRKRYRDEVADEVTIDRVRGSTAIAAMMRSIIALDSPNAAVDARRMRVIKSNLCRAPEPLGLQIGEQVEFCVAPERARNETAAARASHYLLGRLQTGPVRASELYKDAEGCGISKSSLRTAKDKLGIVAKKEEFGDGGYWVWALPARAEPIDHAERQFKEPPEKDLIGG